MIYEEFGEMLFTHFGVSGPIILSASSILNDYIVKGKIDLRIDLKPALSYEALDERILRDFGKFSNKNFNNSLDELLPNKLIDVVINISKIDPYKKVNSITKDERTRLLNLVKAFPVTLNSLRGFEEAIITRGGISCKEINPKTMESKKIEGLYFAGEVIDVDALTGGFNLQLAWSTAFAAANAMLNGGNYEL